MSRSFLLSLSLGLALSGVSGRAVAQNSTSLPASPSAAAADAIRIDVNGTVVPVDPAPLLENGRVFVPLRGVLENLGARLNYVPAERRIDITGAGRDVTLRVGDASALVNGQVTLIEAPRVRDGRAFVPLRALAELFGYNVNWIPAARTVAIAAVVPTGASPRQALDAAGPYGITVDFHSRTVADVPALLDAVKNAGAGLVKTRFDWGTVEPQKGTWDWTLYDAVVREAKARDLVVVGILGNTAPWASLSRSTDPTVRKQSPPRPDEMASWKNYVSRVVERYRVPVAAWQVWENPNAENLRSVSRTYRLLARDAIEAARRVYPSAVIHLAEPGGVDLRFVEELRTNGLAPLADGVSVYPVASWQPNTVASPEEFLRPYAALRQTTTTSDAALEVASSSKTKPRDYWVGGFSFPVARAADETQTPDEEAQRALSLYSEAAQADFLVKTGALALASGGNKLFYDGLQDLPLSARNGVLTGSGLLRSDGTPRAGYEAYQNLTRTVGRKPFRGAVAFNSRLIALLFDDGASGTLIAWSPTGSGRLQFALSGEARGGSELPVIATRPDSQVLSASGQVAGAAAGAIDIGTRPLIVTNVAFETATSVGNDPNAKIVRVGALDDPQVFAGAEQVSATLGREGTEDGLFWRRFLNFGGATQTFELFDPRGGLITQPQSSILDLSSQKPFIYFDVADDFLFNAPGVPVEVMVEVKQPPVRAASVINSAASFRLEYDSTTGFKPTRQQPVEQGDGWVTYTFTLPDAAFANARGYDLLINAGGSKAPLTFGKVTVRRIPNTIAAANVTEPSNAAVNTP